MIKTAVPGVMGARMGVQNYEILSMLAAAAGQCFSPGLAEADDEGRWALAA